MKDLCDAVHEMCQPLTALQCRIEIAQMRSEVDGWVPEPQETAVLWEECVKECGRLNDSVAKLREMLRKVRAEELALKQRRTA